MEIFAGVPRAGGIKYKKCYAYVQTLNKNKCLLLRNRHCTFACC